MLSTSLVGTSKGLKSQKLDFISALPDYWNDEDKTNYELLVADSKRYFPYMDEYIIHLGVMAHINKTLGKGEEANQEDVKELMEKYKSDSIVYTTPFDPDFDFKKTLKEVIEASGVSDARRARTEAEATPVKNSSCGGLSPAENNLLTNIREIEDECINEADRECNVISEYESELL